MSIDNIINSLDKVKKTGHLQYSALCPCHAEKTPSLTVKEASDGNVIIHCFGCGANGMEVVQALGLESSELFKESYKMDNKEKSEHELQRQQAGEFLTTVSSQSVTLNGDNPVTKYLNGRSITAIPNTIRLLPEYKQNGQFHPCMIARIDDNDGNRISYHLTHLTQDGQKASVDIVKKVLPCERDLNGGSVKLFKHTGTLAVCEGIETALSYQQDNAIPAWSLVSAQNMKAWQCPRDVVDLIIVADMDSSFTGQSSAYDLARKSKALIGKDGYKLERINVVLIINNNLITDSGIKVDYLDFSQIDTRAQGIQQ